MPRQAGNELSRRGTRLAPTLLIAGLAIWAAVTCPGVSLTWDESIYVGFAATYHDWFSALLKSGATEAVMSRGTLFVTFELGQVHPPLGKLAMLLSLTVFEGFMLPYVAMRIASVFWYAVALTSLYHLVRTGSSRRAALCAIGVLGLMPRFFGHAHIAALDMPVAALWVSTALFARLSLRRRLYALPLGISFGLALLTKLNALFLPFAIIPWLICAGRKRALLPLLCFVTIGPALFMIGWPAMWHQPLLGLLRYLVDKLGYDRFIFLPDYVSANPAYWLIHLYSEIILPRGRPDMGVFYLGRQWTQPQAPWHYAPVLLIATTPLAFLIGLFGLLRPRVRSLSRRPFVWFLGINLLVAVGPFLRPSTPKYDGVRLFLPALPFLAAFCGIGLVRLWDRTCRQKWLRSRFLRRLVPLLFWGWHVFLLLWLHPLYLSFYGGAVGGVYGAYRLGFETTYWGDTVNSEALAVTAAHAKPGDTIAVTPAGPHMAMQLHRSYNRLPSHVRVTVTPEREEWDVLILIPRQGLFRSWMWDLYLERNPVYEHCLMGVPQVQVYVRREP